MARRGDRNGRLGNLDDGSKKLGPELHAEVVPPKSPRRRNLKDLQQAGGAQILPRPAGINAIDKHPGLTNSFPRRKLGFLLTGPVPDPVKPPELPETLVSSRAEPALQSRSCDWFLPTSDPELFLRFQGSHLGQAESSKDRASRCQSEGMLTSLVHLRIPS